jgi:GAF domain-containing protein/HAMP domain-containing protein
MMMVEPNVSKPPQAAALSRQRRNIYLATGIAMAGALGADILYIYLGLQTGAWQLWALAIDVTTFLVLAPLCIVIIQRGRLYLGAQLLIGLILLDIVVGSLLVSGLGWILGFGTILVMPLLVTQMMLPAKESARAIVACVVLGAAILLVDLYWPFPIDRMPIPYVQAFFPIIIGAALAISLFVITRQFSNYKLQTKLIIAVLIVTLAALAALGGVNQYLVRGTLVEDADRTLQAAAKQTAASVDTFINSNLTIIKTEAQFQDLRNYLSLPADQRAGSLEEKRATQILNICARRDYQNILSYALLDSNGKNVIDTVPADIGAAEAGHDYFQTPLKTGAQYVSPPEFYQPGTERAAIYFSAPVRNNTGEIIGVLRMRHDADVIGEIVKRSNNLIGDQSFAILLDENLVILSHGNAPVFDRKSVAPLSAARLAELQAARRLPAIPGTEFYADLPDLESGLEAARTTDRVINLDAEVDKRGQALERVAITKLQTQPWFVAFAQSQPVFLAPIEDQTKTTTALALGISGLVALATLLVSQLITRPIARLTMLAEQVTQGNLNARAEVKTGDEIGVLAATFNAMTQQLSDMVGSLEARVNARTAQLRAGAEVARAASSILDVQKLLQRTVDLICDRFSYYYAAVFLLDEYAAPGEARYVRLRAGRGEAGWKMLNQEHKFELGQGMVGWVCANKQARIALDVGKDAVHFANPLLPKTRSEIALPLQVGDRILGALDVQSELQAAFDESDIAVLQGMADQIAIAMENARLFVQAQTSLAENEQLLAQIQSSLREATRLYAAGQTIATAQDIRAVFQAIVDNVVESDIDVCMLVLFDPYETDLPQQLTISQVWTRTGTPNPLAETKFDFASFPLVSFLNAAQFGIIHSQTEVGPEAASQKMWHDLGVSALAFVPLNAGARWIGALGVGASEAHTFDAENLRPYSAVAVQAATAIENRRLFESAQASLHELSTLYRSYTREAWTTATQARPELTEYEFVQTEYAGAAQNQLAIPLLVRGQEIGVLEVESPHRKWDEQERAFIESIGTQTALALDSARLFEQTQRLAGRERLINEITARIRASTRVADILQTAARELAMAVNVPHAVARIQIQESPADK